MILNSSLFHFHIARYQLNVQNPNKPTMKLKKFVSIVGLLFILSVFPILLTTIVDAANVNQNTAVNILLFKDNEQHQKDDSVLKKLLTDTSHSHMSDVVDINLANSVWKKMNENALKFAQLKAKQSKPIIEEFLIQANVSNECNQSVNNVIDQAAMLTDWAVQMWNSFGDFPASGLFEGTLNSMGSYRQCVDIEPNELIGTPQYCSFAFQPIIPKRPAYHNILHPIKDLANFTSKTDVS